MAQSEVSLDVIEELSGRCIIDHVMDEGAEGSEAVDAGGCSEFLLDDGLIAGVLVPPQTDYQQEREYRRHRTRNSC